MSHYFGGGSKNVSRRRNEWFGTCVSSRDQILSILSSTFPVFVALAKSYLKSSEVPRFLNKRVIINWESFSATSNIPRRLNLWHWTWNRTWRQNLLDPFGVRHCCSVASALFRVVFRGITCFENWIWWCLYKVAIAELRDGSEGAGRANGCEDADAVDVGVLEAVPTTDEVPNYSKGVVDLFWWFKILRWVFG